MIIYICDKQLYLPPNYKLLCLERRKASESERNCSLLLPRQKISRKIMNISENWGRVGMELCSWLSIRSRVNFPHSLDERRAIKTISKCDVKDKDIFATEVQLLKKLDHPNIIKLYEVY